MPAIAVRNIAGVTVGHDQVEHLAAGVQRDRAGVDLGQQRLAGRVCSCCPVWPRV